MKTKGDLDKKLKILMVDDRYYIRAFGQRTRVIKGDSFYIHYNEEIKSWDKNNLDDFEKKILALEKAKKEIDEEEAINKPSLDRRRAYQQIDHFLLEAIAEKEEGRPEKLKEYLKLRAQIKKDIPKAKE
jgi:hypothetical protein